MAVSFSSMSSTKTVTQRSQDAPQIAGELRYQSDWLAGVPNQMAHRAHHLKLQASSLVLPLSAPAMRSRLNTAFQFPIRSNPYGFTKDTIPPATTPCSKGSQSQRVSGMKTGDPVKSGKFRSMAEWFLMRILGVSYGT
jgi:hypothetical protein